MVRFLWYGLIVLTVRLCWEVRWSYAMYFGMWSFVLWQLLYELWFFAVTFIKAGAYNIVAAVGNIAVFAIGYAVSAMTFSKWMSKDIVSVGPRQLGSGLFIFATFELIGIMQRNVDISLGDSRWELLYLVQLMIAVVLYLQNELFRKSALQQELSLMNLLRKKEHEQYQLTKENIELINQKCHDLKHQIRAIRSIFPIFAYRRKTDLLVGGDAYTEIISRNTTPSSSTIYVLVADYGRIWPT